jgi:hypothetical protein
VYLPVAIPESAGVARNLTEVEPVRLPAAWKDETGEPIYRKRSSEATGFFGKTRTVRLSTERRSGEATGLTIQNPPSP